MQSLDNRQPDKDAEGCQAKRPDTPSGYSARLKTAGRSGKKDSGQVASRDICSEQVTLRLIGGEALSLPFQSIVQPLTFPTSHTHQQQNQPCRGIPPALSQTP